MKLVLINLFLFIIILANINMLQNWILNVCKI